VFKDDNVSKVYSPSEQGMGTVKGVEHQRIKNIPVPEEFHGKKKPLKEFTMWDNEGVETGKKIKRDSSKKLVLLSGGSTGTDVEKLLSEAQKANRKDVQYYVVTGRNKKLREKLLNKKDPNVIVQGFDKNWKGSLDTGDLAILRPHGLTPTEAAARKTPFISAVTGDKGGKFKDSYAPHMVGNAESYKKEFGAPIASISGEDKSKSVGKILNETLDSLDSYKSKIRGAATDSASEIIDSPSATISKVKKISPLGKALAYGTAGAAAAKIIADRVKKKNKK